MLRHLSVFALVTALLAACSDFPELDQAVSDSARHADFPELLPLQTILNQAENTQITEQTVSSLQGRVARLRARANRLRAPVINTAARARMRAAIARHS